MAKTKLTNYLNKIESKYVNARERWERIQKELQAEEIRYQNIKWINLSPQGKIEEGENHKKKVNELNQNLGQIRKDFESDVEEIKKSSDKLFDRVFRYTSGDVDPNGVAILQNSSMSVSELMDFAESYRRTGNYTMYFMISEKLKNDKKFEQMTDEEREGQRYFEESRSRRHSREDHEIMNGFRDICLSGLRNEDYLSNGIHREHEGFYQKYKDAADNIEADNVVPWE